MTAVVLSLANGRQVTFEVDRDRDGPAWFVLGIRKCGSSLLNMLCIELAKLNGRRFLDVGGTFFFENVTHWQRDPAISDLLYSGNVYGGFRAAPSGLADHPIFRDGPKVLMVRDPRDALVSEYFSNAYSHPIPVRTGGMSPATDMMEQLRREALSSDIDTFVKDRVRAMRGVFLDYVGIARTPGTVVVKYEDYIFQKPELIRLIVRHFGWTVTDGEIDAMMGWADLRPATEDPTAFVRRVTPGDHRNKLRSTTIAALDDFLRPALAAYGYPAAGC